MANANTVHTARTVDTDHGVRRVFTETKSALKTTEFWVFVVVTLGIIIAAASIDEGADGQRFGAAQAASYIAIVALGYMISRGLAKAGTRGRERDND